MDKKEMLWKLNDLKFIGNLEETVEAILDFWKKMESGYTKTLVQAEINDVIYNNERVCDWVETFAHGTELDLVVNATKNITDPEAKYFIANTEADQLEFHNLDYMSLSKLIDKMISIVQAGE